MPRVILIAKTIFDPELVPGYRPHEQAETYADELAECAGRLCYLSWERPNPKTRTNRGYLLNILDQQHYSVLEHASATFYIDGVSRNFTHELIRHRHLSFSEVSQRYVDVSAFPVVVPPALQERGWQQTIPVTGNQEFVYNQIVSDLKAGGASRKEGRQAARFILPSGLETKIIVTGNMRAWREVLQKRLSPTADLEFQRVALQILGNLRQISPNIFQDFDVLP